MSDVTKDNFLPSLSDQLSYCYLGNTKYPHNIREMFSNILGITDESINPGIFILPRHKKLFSKFLCQKLFNIEEMPQKIISNP